MNRRLRKVIVMAFCFCIHYVHAQENNSAEENLHHRLSLGISHTYTTVSNETTNEKHHFVAATIGLNYELWFNKKWALASYNDISMQSFTIEQKPEGEDVSREYPLLITLVGIYKPGNHWLFFAGPGKEFELEKNYAVIKTGIEYGVHLSKNWEIGFGSDYDIKIDGYNSWLFGISVSKIFLRK